MTTYNTSARGHNIYPIGNGGMWLMPERQASRTYANGDIVKGPSIERDLKIVNAVVAGEEFDTNGSPTATGKLRVTDGTTTVNVVSVAAATAGTADWVQYLNLQAALGYVIPSRGFWVEFVFDAAFATAAAGILTFGICVSPCMFGSESPLAPTGS